MVQGFSGRPDDLQHCSNDLVFCAMQGVTSWMAGYVNDIINLPAMLGKGSHIGPVPQQMPYRNIPCKSSCVE